MTFSAGDRLLFAVTAAGGMNWREYTRAFHELCPGSDEDLALRRRSTLNALSGLAHCEIVTRDGVLHLCPAPAALARLPLTGLPQAVLVGRRQPSTVGALKAACSSVNAYVEIQHEMLLLDGVAVQIQRIAVEAESPIVLSKFADDLGILYLDPEPAWALCTSSVSLEEIMHRLRWEERPHLDWKHTWFDPSLLHMRPAFSAAENGSGLALWSYEHPYTRKRRFEVRDDNQAAPIERDWGRWAVLAATERQVVLFDDRRHLLAVPAGVPLPKLLGRALCLCSGRMPTEAQIDGVRYQIYPAVPPSIAERVGLLLSQVLLPRNLHRL